MLQKPMLECLSLDDGRCPAEVGVGGRHIAEALVVALVLVMPDNGLDPLPMIAGQEAGLQQHAVLEGLVLVLELTLGLRM